MRMLEGKWIEITTDIVYHQFSTEGNYRDFDYTLDETHPIYLDWDFNLGVGKPLSVCLSQYIPEKDTFHFFNEAIVEGASTEDGCDELAGRGLLDYDCSYIIHGDATGGSRSTKSKMSDYDIMRKYFGNYRSKAGNRMQFEIDVPLSNPPIRTRHNLVNAYCKSASGKTRLYVYRPCKTLLEGFRLTALKKGGSYIEDDSKSYQHVTTAAGYHIARCAKRNRDGRPQVAARQIR